MTALSITYMVLIYPFLGYGLLTTLRGNLLIQQDTAADYHLSHLN